MKEYYQVKTPEENKEWLLPSAFRYYFYTAQYDLAMRTIDELLEQTDSADTNSRTELLAKKINLVTRWKQHYKEGFDAFWEYTSLMEGNHVEETNKQLAEMRSLFEVDKLKIEQAELQARYHRVAFVVLIVLLLVFFIWGLYQYLLTKRLKATKQALILSNEKVAEESERAKASDRMKTEFLQSMCHEIRTPLNAIVGFSSMLEEAEDQEEKHQYITIIEDNNKLLLQLISDILDLSKIEAGTFDIIPERVNAKQLCNDLFQAMQMKATPQVKILLAPELPELIFTSNKNRLYQVLLNFVTNA